MFNSKSARSAVLALLITASGVQIAKAAEAKSIFIGTADIAIDTAVLRCNNIAASIGARSIVSVNWLGLKQCEIVTDKHISDSQSRRFGNHFVYGTAL